MRKQLIETVGKLITDNDKTVLLLGDIGVFGFRKYLENFSDRVYNIGILEQSTISLSSGLSKTGMVPFVHTISPFLVERSFEQLKLNFGYQNLNGNFFSIGSSYDYASLGPTHHCPADVSLLLSIPNFEIIIPGNSKELDVLVNKCYNDGKPTYFRLSEYENKYSVNVSFGKANLIKKGTLSTIICFGNTLDDVINACEDLDVTILYYTTIYPFDFELIQENFNEKIIIIEPFYEGTVNFLVTNSIKNKKYNINNIGIPREFLKNYGNKREHDLNLGLDSKSLKLKIENYVNN
jgi:transketolase